MSKLARVALALCLVVLAGAFAAGCGSGSSGAGADPAGVVPDSAFLYAEATIDPQGSQESAVRSILADLPGSGAPQDRLENLIRQGMREDKSNKLDWDKDIKPWLGDRIGAFVAGDPRTLTSDADVAAALVVATTDPGAARDALEKSKHADAAHKDYRGEEYIVETDGKGDVTAGGVVGGFVVVGTDAGVRAAIDASKSDGKTLAQSQRFKQAVGSDSNDRVGLVYADLSSLLQLATQAAGDSFPGGPLIARLFGGKPFVITAHAENQALVLDTSSLPTSGLVDPSADTTAVLDAVPADSWAALALPGFGEGVSKALDAFSIALGGRQALTRELRTVTGLDLDKDLLSWIGDVGLFADGQGKATIGGGAVITSKQPATSKRALTKIAAAVARSDPQTQVAAARLPGAFGYRLRSHDMPRGLFMVQRGDKVALTYGRQAAQAALSGSGLSGSAAFKRAAAGLGAGYSPSLYVAIAPILGVAEAFGASGKDYRDAKPYLTILDYVIAGSNRGGNQATGRIRIGFKPHD